jgi:GT2 family glycosyltransferase
VLHVLIAQSTHFNPLYCIVYKSQVSACGTPALRIALRFCRWKARETLSIKALGIVIPTHNRIDALLQCLTHLEHQTFTDFEVVVVDDGSTDSTSATMQTYLQTSPLAIRYIAQQNAGPAKARNLGISLLQPALCLLLGDDIFASSTLVESHIKLHQQYPAMQVAALGLTKWSTTGQTITPFMRWLEQSPIQFAYNDLLAGAPPNWHHFYTSNVSARTELLQRFPFNEAFPFAAMEDSELGYRLTKQAALEVKFVPEALADHLHPTTFRQACARMIRVGYSAKIFHELWPEEKPIQSNGLKQKLKNAIERRPPLMRLLVEAGDLCTRISCPNPVMIWALTCHYELGYQSVRDREGKLVRSQQ